MRAFDRPPGAVLVAAPTTGNAPLNVLADASGSTEADGTIVSYRFDFGDGTVSGPQAAATASHVYAAGSFTLSVTVTDDVGGQSTVSVPIIAAATGGGTNLAMNPSFEGNTSGWSGYDGATLQRVPGGFDGASSLQVTGADSVASFGATDSPNWVGATPAAGTRYRIAAWVRADSADGEARLRIREYLGGVRIGAAAYLSNTVELFHVVDAKGYVVRDALVFALGVPYGRILNVPEQPTGQDGWVTMVVQPTERFPLAPGIRAAPVAPPARKSPSSTSMRGRPPGRCASHRPAMPTASRTATRGSRFSTGKARRPPAWSPPRETAAGARSKFGSIELISGRSSPGWHPVARR